MTHFVQGTPAVSGTDFLNERLRKLYELAEVDWDFAKETIVRSFNPDADEQVRRDIVRLITASIDRAEWRRFLDQVEPWDVEADAMGMSTPTLLVHRENPNANLDVLRRVAGLIRNSRVTFSDADDDLQAALVAASMHDAASA